MRLGKQKKIYEEVSLRETTKQEFINNLCDANNFYKNEEYWHTFKFQLDKPLNADDLLTVVYSANASDHLYKDCKFSDGSSISAGKTSALFVGPNVVFRNDDTRVTLFIKDGDTHIISTNEEPEFNTCIKMPTEHNPANTEIAKEILTSILEHDKEKLIAAESKLENNYGLKRSSICLTHWNEFVGYFEVNLPVIGNAVAYGIKEADLNVDAFIAALKYGAEKSDYRKFLDLINNNDAVKLDRPITGDELMAIKNFTHTSRCWDKELKIVTNNATIGHEFASDRKSEITYFIDENKHFESLNKEDDKLEYIKVDNKKYPECKGIFKIKKDYSEDEITSIIFDAAMKNCRAEAIQDALNKYYNEAERTSLHVDMKKFIPEDAYCGSVSSFVKSFVEKTRLDDIGEIKAGITDVKQLHGEEFEGGFDGKNCLKILKATQSLADRFSYENIKDIFPIHLETDGCALDCRCQSGETNDRTWVELRDGEKIVNIEKQHELTVTLKDDEHPEGHVFIIDYPETIDDVFEAIDRKCEFEALDSALVSYYCDKSEGINEVRSIKELIDI